MTPFLGYMPDADPTKPGVITDCSMMEPSTRGMKSAPGANNAGLPALASACQGAALAVKLDGTKRLFAATQTKLWEAGASSWADVSKSGSYTGAPDARWNAVQFGDVTIATNGVDPVQASSSGAFADLAGAPKCRLMETCEGFVIAANLTDAAYPHADGWWCSALYDHTNWTPAIATQSARARLLDSPGAINALRALGSTLVAFKARSMYRGQYVGPDVIWAWDQVPGDVGAFSQSGVISDGSALYWWGGDDFYRYDGTRPAPIGADVKRWFAQSASQQYLHKMLGHYDRAAGLARWYFVPSGQTEPAACVVLNTRTGRWGRADRAVQALVDYVSAGLAYDTPGILAGVTYDTTAWGQSFDSPFWLAASESPAIIDSARVLRTLTAVSAASSITTGDVGDDEVRSLLSAARLRFVDAPNSASMTNYWMDESGETPVIDQTVPGGPKFDVLRSAFWHRLRFDFAGNVEVSAFRGSFSPDGAR
ncbi:MAG: hypothetical protein LT106_18570 [Burkholderiaceae bacterium]|nr:hypothetical protein [Burkholderiaceae bacterium]